MLPDLLQQMGFIAADREVDRPAVGVSACLTGRPVRYDGGHRRHARVHDELAGLVRLVEVCPEVAVGLPVPRPPIQVVQIKGARRVRHVTAPRQDLTEALADQAGAVGPALSGFVVKSRSPSCGLGTTPVHDDQGRPFALGDGAFAGALARRHPDLPMANDSDLDAPLFTQAFLLRVFCHHHWRTHGADGLTTLRARSGRLDEPLLSGTRRFLDRLAAIEKPLTPAR
ncbi:DUF523 domain-containing protein [Alcanivorax marinus]|uniref:DUF523 domain-containing protein n=1 Tax=Alloalcanivorax marinus TaxID=1177169 RepID=A0A9Q3ULJ8_9GAMM|nr:DUF523 domain-containing protein [Alloalcanivorax marinus]MCC4309207.1 DUF523 domain-containing protein [Alloalcanivorax marinus]MCU5786777.1 hypothetical protein [Alloalcanivorax marinus]